MPKDHIIQYVRKHVGYTTDSKTGQKIFKNEGHRIGVLVGKKVNNQIFIGWAACSKKDKFNPVVAIELAKLRLDHDIKYHVSDTPTHQITKCLPHFNERCLSYFKVKTPKAPKTKAPKTKAPKNKAPKTKAPKNKKNK